MVRLRTITSSHLFWMFVQPLGNPFYKVTLFPTDAFTFEPQEHLRKIGHPAHGSTERGAIYLKLLDNELCILNLETTANENWHALTLDSFPESYMLLISVSSTPISFYQY